MPDNDVVARLRDWLENQEPGEDGGRIRINLVKDALAELEAREATHEH